MANALLQEVAYLKEGGFSEKQASTLIFFHKNQIDTHLSTKKDTLSLQKEVEGVKKEVEVLKKEVEGVKKEIISIKKDLEILKYSLTVRLGGMIFAGFFLLAGYIGYLGHKDRDLQSYQLQQFLDTQRQIISILEQIPKAKPADSVVLEQKGKTPQEGK